MCTVCRNQIPLTEFNFFEENAVDRTFYGRTDIKKASSFLLFTDIGIVKNLIHNLKYRNQKQIGLFLGEWYGQIIKENNYLNKIDFIIPVPLHKNKMRRRGYNQVSLFSHALAKHLNCTVLENVLVKTANTKTQTKKTRLGRWQNQKNLYHLTKPSLINGKNILLLDDVITTGATMEMCANSILKAKDVNLYVASMAIVL